MEASALAGTGNMGSPSRFMRLSYGLGHFSAVNFLRKGILRILSHLQNCHQSEDMCRGTTSVVPQMARSDSGFSRCGTANKRKQIDAGAKAQHLFDDLEARVES